MRLVSLVSENEQKWLSKKNLTGRIRTIGLGISIVNFYSPPLYQLSYGESYVCLVCYDLVIT